MDYCETSQGSVVRTILSDEELGFSQIDNFIQKTLEWQRIAKEGGGGRKTRSANRKADTLYEELMSWKCPPIKLQPLPWAVSNLGSKEETESVNTGVDSSAESSRDSSSSRPVTRSLRSRSKTPVVSNNTTMKQTPSCPSTPLNQRIRGKIAQATPQSSGVLSAALNQQHPSVSVTKIRQLLRADSAQKKREEEKERQERLLQERQFKEERAEARKRQLLEERAINAKIKREQRLNHAAEIRKAKVQEAKQKQQHKQEEEIAKLAQTHHQVINNNHNHNHNQNTKSNNPVQHEKEEEKKKEKKEKPQAVAPPDQPEETTDKPNETFQKPEVNNIQISIQNETTDSVREQKSNTAAWARAPHLRNALIEQFSKSDAERLKEVFKLFPPVQLPIDLEEIFGRHEAGNLCRTSSAVWSPANGTLKRTSSMSQTPTYPKKH